MLKTTATIEQIGKEIYDFLSVYIKVERLILFGSYAYGNARKDSDFDVAVISEDFDHMSILKKIELFSKVGLMVVSIIELRGFTEKEFFNIEKASMLKLIKDKGKVIYPVPDKNLLTEKEIFDLLKKRNIS